MCTGRGKKLAYVALGAIFAGGLGSSTSHAALYSFTAERVGSIGTYNACGIYPFETRRDCYATSSPATPYYTENLLYAGTACDDTFPNYGTERYVATFDTSALPDDENISSATLKLHTTYVSTGLSGQSYAWVPSASSNGDIQASDIWGHFPLVSSTWSGSWEGIRATQYVSSTLISTSSFNSFSLTATGTAAINRTGYTKFILLDNFQLIKTNPGCFNQAGTLYEAAQVTSTRAVLEVQTGAAAAAFSITVTRPANGTTTPDFTLGFWHGTATVGATSSLQDGVRANVQFQYCRMPDCFSTLIEENAVFFYGATGTVNFSLDKQYSLFAGTWQGFAYLLDGFGVSSTQLAQSAQFSFTIPGAYTEPTSTPPTIEGVCESSSTGFFAGVGTAICNALSYLFIPSVSQQQDLSGSLGSLRDQISTKPPFGYLTQITDITNTMAVSETSTKIISTSTVASMSSVFAPLRAGLVMLFWVLFGAWIYKRAAHLEL